MKLYPSDMDIQVHGQGSITQAIPPRLCHPQGSNISGFMNARQYLRGLSYTTHKMVLARVLLFLYIVTLSTGFARTHVQKHDLQLRGYVTCNMGDNIPIIKDPVVVPTRKDTITLKRKLNLTFVTCNMEDNIPIRGDPVVFPVRKDTMTLDRKFNLTFEENMAMQMQSTIDWYREGEWKNVID